ncbi:MAG: cellulase family glycosylhydrolase, partial [Bacteroidota bacterium]|nr:cellulase family glycosylhydrolase [Bacteroidota bacterium]
SRYGIRPIFVIFDDCWNPYPKIGKQPQPIPHTHNSGWVQDPGMDAHNDWAKAMPTLEKYVKDILTTFGKDNRILMWDLYNEPGNQGPVNKTAPRFPAYGNKSMPLVKNAFKWAREVNPSQPLTMGIWNLDLTELNQYQTAHSDVITYHNYSEKADHEKNIKYLQLFNRPIVCTEYMSRGSNSTFGEILPILKKYHVGAINWGFVSGKTQTIYPWDSWEKDYTTEPELWFHDIFRKDLTPYKEGEVQLIRDLTGKK